MPDANPPRDEAATEEKIRKLQKAYEEFMAGFRGLERERLEIMKKALGEAEQEQIQKILDQLKGA
jgi:hypothetical protein